MNNYDRAFDLIGISRSGGGFGLSGGASGEAPYNPYRMWVDKGNIDENSSIGVSQQLKKQGQIEAKAREEYEREQRKQWDEAHKNEKSGSFSDAEKQQRDADVKEKMKEYDSDVKENDSDLTLQEETIKRIRPDLSSAEAANERRAAERKKQREDAALAAAHSYLEGIDDGHGEPDLSSGGTPPPKKKQSSSGDTNKVAKEALEKTGTPKEVPAAEIKRPAIVEPDNLELKVGEELLTYETEGVYYALYAYNEDEFGQTRLPQWLEDLRSVGSTAGDYLITRFSGGQITLKPYEEQDIPEWVYDTLVPPSTKQYQMLFGSDPVGSTGQWETFNPGELGMLYFGYNPSGGDRNGAPALVPFAGAYAEGEEPSLGTPTYLMHPYGRFDPEFTQIQLEDLITFDGGVVAGNPYLIVSDANARLSLTPYEEQDIPEWVYDTLVPPSTKQYQMLFGSDPVGSTGQWETFNPGELGMLYFGYNPSGGDRNGAPALVPFAGAYAEGEEPSLGTPTYLMHPYGRFDPEFTQIQLEDLITSDGGVVAGNPYLIVSDANARLSLTPYEEQDIPEWVYDTLVPPSTKQYQMLFGSDPVGSTGQWETFNPGELGMLYFGYNPSGGDRNGAPALVPFAGAYAEGEEPSLGTPTYLMHPYGRFDPEFTQIQLEDLITSDGGVVAGNPYLIVSDANARLSLTPYEEQDIPDVSDFLEEVTPSDLVMASGLDEGYALYAYSSSSFGQFPIPPDWIYSVPAATAAGLLTFDGTDQDGIDQYSWLGDVGFVFAYGGTVSGMMNIPTDRIDATNSPALNQYPKYAGNNQVTWTTFPTIPDVSDFLEEVTPSDLVMAHGLDEGYALYAYSSGSFGQFPIPPDWIYSVPAATAAGLLTFDGTDQDGIDQYSWLGDVGFVFAYGGTVSGMMNIPTDRIDATNSPALNQYPKYAGNNQVTWTTFPTIPDVSDFLEEVTPSDLVMAHGLDEGYALYAYSSGSFGQFPIPPDWIYSVPAATAAGLLTFDGTDQDGIDQYSWLGDVGFVFAYGGTVSGMMNIPTDRIDATNSPALNQYPKYAGNNQVTWTTFPTIPDVSDFLEEVTPSDLVMAHGLDEGYALYAYSSGSFGQFPIPPDWIYSVPAATAAGLLTFDGTDQDGIDQYSWLGDVGFVFAYGGTVSGMMNIPTDRIDATNSPALNQYPKYAGNNQVTWTTFPTIPDVSDFLEEVTPSDLVMAHGLDEGYALYAYSSSSFGQFPIPPDWIYSVPAATAAGLLTFDGTDQDGIDQYSWLGDVGFVFAYGGTVSGMMNIPTDRIDATNSPALNQYPKYAGNNQVTWTTFPTIPDVSDFLEEVTPSDLVMAHGLDEGYALYAYSSGSFGQFPIPPDWIYSVPAATAAGLLTFDGTDQDGIDQYSWLGDVGFVFAYGGTVSGMMNIPTDRIDATNSPALNQYPKYAGNNQVTWTTFPTIPDVSDFLEEVTPSDLVMAHGLDEGYALYAYSSSSFGQFPIPPDWIYSVPAATAAGLLTFDGTDQDGIDQYSWLGDVGFVFAYGGTVSGMMNIPTDRIDATNSPALNQYPKYAGNNKVTWTKFPTIPDVDDFLEEVRPSDLVMAGGLNTWIDDGGRYALYVYSSGGFGQIEIPYIGWCGLVYVGEEQFYDADIVPVANRRQNGTAIIDNSTDGAKTWVKVLYNGESFTDAESYAVTYEDERSVPTPQNEWWYRTEEHTSPIVILNLFGAESEHLVYQRLANVGDYAKYGFAKIKSSAIDATNSPALNQYPKYAGNNKVTWTKFPTIPDVDDFLEEVRPSDLVMAGGLNTWIDDGGRYALYVYSSGGFGQIEIPDISGGSQGEVFYHDGYNPTWLDVPSSTAVMVFDYTNTTPKWIAPSADYEVLYRYNGSIGFGELRAT